MRAELRTATTEDLDQLVELRILMQTEVHQGRTVPTDYAERVRAYFIRNMKAGTVVSAVAVDGDRILSLGTVNFYEKTPSIDGKDGRVGYVSNVYTRPEHRGQGLSGLVMGKIVEIAREAGADKIHLTATPLGKGVYERVGFVPPKFAALEIRLPQR